jgi:hypothetical protein
MGRSLHWYIIPKQIDHDKTKEICLDLEFEPDLDLDSIFDKLYLIKNPNFIEDYESEKKKKDLYFDLIVDKENNCNCCQKCLMYLSGLYDSSLVINSYNISYCYSNNIWGSNWHISNYSFNNGNRKSDLIKRFDKKHMYSEISFNDLNDNFNHLNSLGDPIRTIDKKAFDETLAILNFMKQYIYNREYIIIFEDDR